MIKVGIIIIVPLLKVLKLKIIKHFRKLVCWHLP